MTSDKLMLPAYKYSAIAGLIFLFICSGLLAAADNYVPAVILALMGLILLLLIIGTYENTIRQIRFFFDALKNNDTSIRFQVNTRNRTMYAIYNGMNQLNSYFQSIKMQNEYNENYYKAILHHAASGIAVLDADNKLLLMNRTACRYAGIPYDFVNANLPGIKNPPFMQAISRLEPGGYEVYKQVDGTDYHMLAFRAALFRIADKDLKIVSIHDIRSEMEARELESYRKLISVMTHEIMNLISPLTSVSSSLHSIYDSPAAISRERITDEIISTTQTGLQLIYEHSVGLKEFIENYRKISRIPRPVKKVFSLNEWIAQIKIAFSESVEKNNIRFAVIGDLHHAEITADKTLLNQVIVNLVNNAIDALQEISENKELIIEFSEKPDKRLRIAVSNNGPVIPPEIIDRIFVPFFTTKSNGSGIGLSVCQEIIRLHGGSLVVLSPSSGMTTFMIEL